MENGKSLRDEYPPIRVVHWRILSNQLNRFIISRNHVTWTMLENEDVYQNDAAIHFHVSIHNRDFVTLKDRFSLALSLSLPSSNQTLCVNVTYMYYAFRKSR